jgi:hypothetical protein
MGLPSAVGACHRHRPFTGRFGCHDSRSRSWAGVFVDEGMSVDEVVDAV